MYKGFWDTLERPIIAMSPMDGVTDAAYRYITDKYGKPAILFTEFTSVEGIAHGATRLLSPFVHHRSDTPVVAQIYGSTPQAFYDTTFVVCEMGFDGIDINMGCPDYNISKKGCGAGLIRTPQLAYDIIKSVQQAVQDWADGKKIEDTNLKPDIVSWVKEYSQTPPSDLSRSTPLEKMGDPMDIGSRSFKRKLLPVSVKTRIGYDSIITEDWISNLLEAQPANISIHGRTLVQMYTGMANWDEIGKAAQLIRKTNTSVLGNGDVKTIQEAKEKAKQYNLDGVLIGRASFGNPWLFKEYEPTQEERIKVAIEHCETFSEMTPDLHFLSLRKHLAWYTKGIPGSNELRRQLMTVENVADVKRILQ